MNILKLASVPPIRSVVMKAFSIVSPPNISRFKRIGHGKYSINAIVFGACQPIISILPHFHKWENGEVLQWNFRNDEPLYKSQHQRNSSLQLNRFV